MKAEKGRTSLRSRKFFVHKHGRRLLAAVARFRSTQGVHDMSAAGMWDRFSAWVLQNEPDLAPWSGSGGVWSARRANAVRFVEQNEQRAREVCSGRAPAPDGQLPLAASASAELDRLRSVAAHLDRLAAAGCGAPPEVVQALSDRARGTDPLERLVSDAVGVTSPRGARGRGGAAGAAR